MHTPPGQTAVATPFALRWAALEAPFAADGYAGDPDAGDPDGLVVVGAAAPTVVVTAPHACNHRRDDRTKLADRGTGGLALLLAEVTGCAAVVALGAAGGDANWDAHHQLKDRLAALRPAAVVDLHGMRTRPGYDLDLGLGPGVRPAGTDAAVEALRATGLRVTTDGLFDAMRPTTVTAWAQAQGVPAVQVEVGAHLRPPVAGEQGQERLAGALLAALGAIAAGIRA